MLVGMLFLGTYCPSLPGEVSGSTYHFVSEELFKFFVDQKLLKEWGQFNQHCYGSLKNSVEVRPQRDQEDQRLPANSTKIKQCLLQRYAVACCLAKHVLACLNACLLVATQRTCLGLSSMVALSATSCPSSGTWPRSTTCQRAQPA